MTAVSSGTRAAIRRIKPQDAPRRRHTGATRPIIRRGTVLADLMFARREACDAGQSPARVEEEGEIDRGAPHGQGCRNQQADQSEKARQALSIRAPPAGSWWPPSRPAGDDLFILGEHPLDDASRALMADAGIRICRRADGSSRPGSEESSHPVAWPQVALGACVDARVHFYAGTEKVAQLTDNVVDVLVHPWSVRRGLHHEADPPSLYLNAHRMHVRRDETKRCLGSLRRMSSKDGARAGGQISGMDHELSDTDLDEIEQRAGRAFSVAPQPWTPWLETRGGRGGLGGCSYVQFGGDTDHDTEMYFEVHLGAEQLASPDDWTRSSISLATRRRTCLG